ncbi:MAG TPA: sigma-70 family RNA polymerase sigma factor [Cellulomonas sp.]
MLDALVRDRGPALVGYGYLLTGNVREAEDLVQDSLVKVFSRGRPVHEVNSAEAYVRRTMLTTYIDDFRRRRRWASIRHLVADADVTGPAAGPEVVVTDRLAVHQALASLAPRERACVVLRYFDDLPIAEIASVLSLSQGAVKRYLSDGTRALEVRLGPLGEGGAPHETAPVEPRRTR